MKQHAEGKPLPARKVELLGPDDSAASVKCDRISVGTLVPAAGKATNGKVLHLVGKKLMARYGQPTVNPLGREVHVPTREIARIRGCLNRQ